MRVRTILLFLLLAIPFISSAQYTKIRNGVWKGTASYYHNMFEGRKTANGEIFRQSKLTAANNFLPLGTLVRVTNIKNGKSIVVKINDRMNKRMKRLIDLSRESARRLGFIHAGLAQVRMEVIGRSKGNLIARNKKTAKKKTAFKKKTAKKVVAYKKTKRKKTKRIVKKEKKSKKLIAKNLTKKKVSRYHSQKQEVVSKRKKQSILSKAVLWDLNWSNTLAYYQESYAKEAAYVEGGPLSFLDNGQILKSFLKPKASTEYAFVLVSKKLQTPKSFSIEPIDSVTHEPIANHILSEVKPKFSKKGNHFIYYFTYSVPEGTGFLRFTVDGIHYENAKSEDFALFIFDE